MVSKDVALVGTLSDAQFLTKVSEAVDSFNLEVEQLRSLWATAQQRWLEKEGRARTAWETKVGERFGKIRLRPTDRLELEWPDGQPERSRARMMGVAQKTVNNDRKALSNSAQSTPKPATRGTRKASTKPEPEPTWIDDDDNNVDYVDGEPVIVEGTVIDEPAHIEVVPLSTKQELAQVIAQLHRLPELLSKADKRKLLTALRKAVTTLEE